MNVNNSTPPGTEQYRSLRILDELANNDSLSQRDLSSRLGIALGLVNSYIKNLVKKGFITVKTIPTKRYAYYLTPKGFTEKTRLTYDLLHDYTRVYREARQNLKKLLLELQESGATSVIFAGADEVAEIAYLTLQETTLELSGIVDEEFAGKQFFGHAIRPLTDIGTMPYDYIVITSYLKREKMLKTLLAGNTEQERIRTIF